MKFFLPLGFFLQNLMSSHNALVTGGGDGAVLDGIDDIAIHHFSERDVVRHKLVQKIILAYEKHERESARKAEEARKRYTSRPTRDKN